MDGVEKLCVGGGGSNPESIWYDSNVTSPSSILVLWPHNPTHGDTNKHLSTLCEIKLDGLWENYRHVMSLPSVLYAKEEINNVNIT